MKNNTLLFCLFLLLFFTGTATVKAQMHVGVYQGGILNHIGLGTNPEKQIFGEARILAGDVVNPFIGLEVMGQYNLKQTDWYNAHVGLMVGYTEFDDGRFGLPVGLSFKPIAAHRQFAVVMEGTPMYAFDFTFRALVGLRYTFSKED